ncbi:MAG TPA: BON domain-containing protein [Thermomicrobiales bacterium]
MSGRDFGRGGRGGFGDRDDRRGGGGFRDREGGGFRDRGSRDAGAPPSRPWERRDGDDRPTRPTGDRPFDRPFGDRPAGPPPDRDVRVERYADVPSRSPRDDRFGDRPSRAEERFNRFGPPRDAAPRATPPAAPPPAPAAAPERPTAAPRNEELKGAAAAAARPKPQGWTQAHLMDSWLDESRLKGWTPSDREQQEMIEDNIEADPQVPGRDFRAISVRSRSGAVTLTGTVRSRAVKFAAGSDAYWTFGVLDVKNELEVRPRGLQTATAAPAPTEATPVADTPKRVSKAAATAAAIVGPENVVDAALTPEELAVPENTALASTTTPMEEPAGDLDEANVTPEEVASPENQAAPDMIESEQDDEI